MATSGAAPGAAGRRNSDERATWRVCPPHAGWCASTGPASVAKSRSSAFSHGVPANAGTASVSSSPGSGASGMARSVALTYSTRIGAGPDSATTGTGSWSTSAASVSARAAARRARRSCA